MEFNEFRLKSSLPEHLKTFENWLEWVGHFDYYYQRERYGEMDSVIYADDMILQKFNT